MCQISILTYINYVTSRDIFYVKYYGKGGGVASWGKKYELGKKMKRGKKKGGKLH